MPHDFSFIRTLKDQYMLIELKVPGVGESIVEVQIGEWLKGEGEIVQRDEAVVEIESEKATVELPAPSAGQIKQILKQTGEMAAPDEVIGYLDDQVTAQSSAPASNASPAQTCLPRQRDQRPRFPARRPVAVFLRSRHNKAILRNKTSPRSTISRLRSLPRRLNNLHLHPRRKQHIQATLRLPHLLALRGLRCRPLSG